MSVPTLNYKCKSMDKLYKNNLLKTDITVTFNQLPKEQQDSLIESINEKYSIYLEDNILKKLNIFVSDKYDPNIDGYDYEVEDYNEDGDSFVSEVEWIEPDIEKVKVYIELNENILESDIKLATPIGPKDDPDKYLDLHENGTLLVKDEFVRVLSENFKDIDEEIQEKIDLEIMRLKLSTFVSRVYIYEE